MRFSIRQENPESPLTFQLLGDNDEVLLSSGTYDSRDSCTEGIRAVISALRDPEAFSIQPDNAVFLRGPDGTILVSSSSYPSRQAATASIAALVAHAEQNTQYDVTLSTTRTRRATQQRAFQRVSPAELVALYNFTRASSGAPGFELYREEEDKLYYFHFNDASGKATLFGRGFAGASKRDRRVEAVIRNAGIEKRYDIQEEGGQFFFILKARNGQEIARSRMFVSREEAQQSIGYLISSIPPYADQYVKKRKARSQSQSNVYNFAHASASGQRGFEPFRNDETKQHFFHFNDDNGKALLFSQGYSSAKSRDNGIRSVIRNAALQERFESKEHNGKYYFILRAGNRQEIAQSRFFASADERDEWITFFLGTISGYAGAYGVSQTSAATTTETESFTLDAPAVAAGLAGAAGSVALSGDGDATEEIPEASVSGAGETAGVYDAGKADVAEEEYEAAYASGGGGFRLWLPWIIGLLAAALILFWLLSMLDGCGGNRANMAGAGESDNTTQQEIVSAGPAEAAAAAGAGDQTSEESDGADSAGEGEISAGAGSTGEPPAPLGPDATALGFASGSLAARIADALSKPDRSLPASFVMDKINFPRHSAKLNKSAYSQVDDLIALMKAYPGLKIKFEGHIDSSEDDGIAKAFMNGENITLSAVRARCLYLKFEEAGINTAQLDFEGLGATNPVADNNSDQNKQRNRRLEILISE